MSRFDEAVYKVVIQMLKVKNCSLDDRFMLHTLVEKLRNKIRDIGTLTCNAGNHAGRTVPSFFDLERTFGQMGIVAADLKVMCLSQTPTKPAVRCPESNTRDEDFHKGPEPMLSETITRELAGCSHIPDNFPPYPGAHTHKSTMMQKSTKKNYVEVRETHAENQLSAQRALNGFYVGCEPYISLVGGTLPPDDIFKVLIVDPRQKMACLDALMPHSEVFENDVYEATNNITDAALKCPFLMEPKMESTHQYDGVEDVVMHVASNELEPDSDSDEDESLCSVSD